MMYKKTLVILAGVAVIFGLAGCSVRHGDFTFLTNKNIGYPDMSKSENLGLIKGIAKKPIIIIIPTGTPHLEDAVDDALRKSGGDYLTDASVHYSWWYFPYIYGEYKWVVEGSAWKIK